MKVCSIAPLIKKSCITEAKIQICEQFTHAIAQNVYYSTLA